MSEKTIQVGILTAIITSVLILGGIAITDDNVYYCSDRSIVMECDTLSQYYGLENGKCNNADIGNKLCRSGWLEVKPETVSDTFNISNIIECETVEQEVEYTVTEDIWNEVNETYNTITHAEFKTENVEVCNDIKMFKARYGSGQLYVCNYSDWGCCTFNTEEQTATCDSKYDGNCDGVCQSGESCTTISFIEYPAAVTVDTYDRLEEYEVECVLQ